MYVLLQKWTVEILYISFRNTHKPQHRSTIHWQLRQDKFNLKKVHPWKVLICYYFGNSISVSLQTTLRNLFFLLQKINAVDFLCWMTTCYSRSFTEKDEY